MKSSSMGHDSQSPGRPWLKYAQREAGRQCRAELRTWFQVLLGNVLWPQNGFRGLRMRADDDGIGNGAQTPTRCDALDLLRVAPAIAAGADQRCVWPAIEPIERNIVSAIEQILHLSLHRPQIFRV